MSPISRTPRLRRTACAVALPALPFVLLAGTLVSPTDSTKNPVQLRAAVAHGARWQAAALCELLAAAIFPLVVAGIVHVVRRRGSGLAHVGAVLGGLGTIGLAAIAFRHLFVYGMAGIDHAAALHALHRVDTGAGLVALPCMVAGPLALIVLAAAAVRAGLAPRWTVAGATVFFVADMLPLPGAEIVQMAVGLATFGTIGLRLLRLGDAGWEAPAPARTAAAEPQLEPAAA